MVLPKEKLSGSVSHKELVASAKLRLTDDRNVHITTGQASLGRNVKIVELRNTVRTTLHFFLPPEIPPFFHNVHEFSLPRRVAEFENI